MTASSRPRLRLPDPFSADETRFFYLVGIFGLALFVTGCATDKRTVEQTRKIEMGDYLLSATNAAPGSVYELRVYVIASGDTEMEIAKQFQISLSDLKALNPGLKPFRLRVGQKIRVFEQKQDEIQGHGSTAAPL